MGEWTATSEGQSVQAGAWAPAGAVQASRMRAARGMSPRAEYEYFIAISPSLRLQALEDRGIFLLHGEQAVAERAVLRDRPPVRALVRVVVAAEAAGRVFMTDVIGVGPPTDLHRWKYVGAIDHAEDGGRVADRRALRGRHGGILFRIEILEPLGDPLAGRTLRRIGGLEQPDRFAVQERQVLGQAAVAHRRVDLLDRHVEGVARPVVAVDAVHGARDGARGRGSGLVAADLAGGVLHLDLVDRLPLVVREIADADAGVDVPVDPLGGAPLFAAHPHEEHGLLLGVGLVVAEAGDDLDAVAHELARPVALLAG